MKLTSTQVAKCLKYMGYTTVCDVAFGLFVVAWFMARHVFYMMVCYSIWAHSSEVMGHGCYTQHNGKLSGPTPPPQDSLSYLIEPFINSDGVVCMDHRVKWSFLSALLFLQCITIFWFFMIVQVIMRVIRGEGAEDVRSDDEEEEEQEEEDEIVYEEAQALEEEVGVEAIDFKNWERRSGVKRQASTSATGVSLPGHSDRKELLNRIGCEKQID